MTVLHAEWTKFRTVRGWVTGMVLAGLLVVLVAALAGVSSDQRGSPPVPVGPGGEPVTDSFFFVHRPLTGDGSVSVSVAALSSRIPERPGELRPGLVPWAKAGIVLRRSDRPGAPYAAIMATAGHGVRMQADYVGDTAAPGPGPEGRQLRLDRRGDTVTGYVSVDGTTWTEVGSARVTGLGSDSQVGFFVASPPAVDGLGTRGTVSTAVFEDLTGDWTTGGWTGEQLGAESPTFAGYPDDVTGSFQEAGGRFTVTGAGDLAPAVRETLPTGGTVGDILTGTFAALVAVVVVGALVVTTEYRTAQIHVTLAASPRREQVLLAKAVVLGTVSFVTGLAGVALAVPLGERLARAHGLYVFPVTSATGLRVALGSAALLAASSILALSVGTIVRHGAGAVVTVFGAVVLPYLLIANPFLPAGAARWVAGVTPVAGFAVQQTLVRYDQVASHYTPYNGYYPLPPWAGLAVLAGYALLSLLLAVVVLKKRDA